MELARLLKEVRESVRLDGFARIVPRKSALQTFQALSMGLCMEFIPSIGREALQQDGEGSPLEAVHHTPAGNFTLLGHSERAYRPCRPLPDYALFLCLEAPASETDGGATTLVDGQRMMGEIPPELLARFRDEGVIYAMEWGPERWRQEFEVTSRDELVLLLRSAREVWFGLDGDLLSLRWRTSPFLQSWSNGKEAFANGILAHLPLIPDPELAAQHTYCHPTNKVFWGSGELMNETSLCQLIAAHERCVTASPWRTGEILVVDNTRIMHGRRLLRPSAARTVVGCFGMRRSTLS